MGIQEGAGPEWEHPGGPTYCIGPHPPLPQIGGKGTQRQGQPAYPLIYDIRDRPQGPAMIYRSGCPSSRR
jgi:hypothetical protein